MTHKELRLVRIIADELSALRKEISAARAEQQAERHQASQQPVHPLTVEVRSESPVREYYEAENQDHNSRWRKLKPWVETVGVSTAIVLAVFTFCTLQQIKLQTPGIMKSADAAQDVLRVSQRAYLSPGSADITPDGVKIHLMNFGHVPAKLLISRLSYARIEIPSGKTLETHDFNIPGGAPIPPQTATQFSLYITLPTLTIQEQRAVSVGSQEIAVFGTLNFDGGFGVSDNVVINFVKTKHGWTKMDEGFGVDARK